MANRHRVMGVVASLVCVLPGACLTTSNAGCVTSRAQPHLTVTPAATTAPSAGDSPSLDVQQLSGQIAAGVQAEIASRVETAVETTLRATGVAGDVAGYRSEFGVGATLVVTLALVLALLLSHRREMQRIKQNGRHAAERPGGLLT